jgi:hypothetical protein
VRRLGIEEKHSLKKTYKPNIFVCQILDEFDLEDEISAVTCRCRSPFQGGGVIQLARSFSSKAARTLECMDFLGRDRVPRLERFPGFAMMCFVKSTKIFLQLTDLPLAVLVE